MKLLLYGQDNIRECAKILMQWLPVFPQGGDTGSFLLLQHGNQCCCILDPSREKSSAFARERRLDCLTCGFSSYDSLVLSSRMDGQAIVTLQRQLFTFNGSVVEPGDRLLYIRKELSDHNLLLCCGALLLSGLETGEKISL